MRKLIFGILLLICAKGFGQIIPGVVASSISVGGGSSLLTGLYGYWKMDETGGDIIDAHDSYNGADYNITYSQAGVINTALSFNGTTSSVQFGNVIKPTAGLSISLWVKYTTPAAEKYPVCHTTYDTAWRGWRIAVLSDGNFEFMLCDGTDAEMLEKFDGGGAIGDNAWHHIVCTWDGTTAYTYHDNNKSAGSSWAHTISYASLNELFFARADGESNFYSGLMDEVAIWNRALTDTEVTTLFNKTPYPF
jgi:hypothetical protein